MLKEGISEEPTLESPLQTVLEHGDNPSPDSKSGLFVLSGGDVSRPKQRHSPCHIAFLYTHSPQVTLDPAVIVSAAFYLHGYAASLECHFVLPHLSSFP